MWGVVALLVVLIWLGRRREGMDDPADAAEEQKGKLYYLRDKKVKRIAEIVSPEILDKYNIKVTELETKVSELDMKMKQFLETKQVNDTMGYPEGKE